MSERTAAVQARAAVVHADYVARARLLDTRHHRCPPAAQQRAQGMIGPVLEVLRQYPEVRGLVWGAYGEASRDVHTLLEEIADRIAERQWGSMGARTRSEARAHIVHQLRRRWGVAAARECARLRLSRLRYVGAPRSGPQRGRALSLAPDAAGTGRHPETQTATRAGAASRCGWLGAEAGERWGEW